MITAENNFSDFAYFPILGLHKAIEHTDKLVASSLAAAKKIHIEKIEAQSAESIELPVAGSTHHSADSRHGGNFGFGNNGFEKRWSQVFFCSFSGT